MSWYMPNRDPIEKRKEKRQRGKRGKKGAKSLYKKRGGRERKERRDQGAWPGRKRAVYALSSTGRRRPSSFLMSLFVCSANDRVRIVCGRILAK